MLDGKMAADLFISINDARLMAALEEECWKVSRKAASTVDSLGIQEVARKRRWGSKQPGAWAGSIVKTT
jgi:hypothetical protein